MAHSEGRNGTEEWGGDYDPFADPEEKRVIFAALDSFYQYGKAAHYNTTHLRRQNFYALPTAHWELLAEPPISYLDTLSQIDDRIDANAKLATQILTTGLAAFNLPHAPPTSQDPDPEQDWRGKATASDMSKAHTMIRQFYRDWSAEGAAERNKCYGPLLSDLAHEFGGVEDKGDIQILVPGAGLGRLVFEIANEGYTVQGNEISYHALMASSWILNHTAPDEKYDLYPWIHTFSNHASREEQLRGVVVPDVHPGTALTECSSRLGPSEKKHAFERLSMCAADFTVLYSDENHCATYDAVVTCFFIDTAPNFVRLVETVRNCLVRGGVWCNLGPLLWHFEESERDENKGETGVETKDGGGGGGGGGNIGMGEAGSVELTGEEVVLLVERFGFEIEMRDDDGGGGGGGGAKLEMGYIQNPSSMLQSVYRASHWVARKIR